ncbi:hypothetical protein ACP70R_029200 [Stipagrostis hirtigluma subsp. patula]
MHGSKLEGDWCTRVKSCEDITSLEHYLQEFRGEEAGGDDRLFGGAATGHGGSVGRQCGRASIAGSGGDVDGRRGDGGVQCGHAGVAGSGGGINGGSRCGAGGRGSGGGHPREPCH